MTRGGADYDIFVVGGGINGVGVARDAAGRGYEVCLAEMNDLASGTSSWSTKLIHGGLRYLEHYHFGLVRKALIEREILWANAPHIIWPLRFVLPHHDALRPRWLLRLGLFLYDHLGGRKMLPPTATLDLSADPAGAPLKPFLRTGFEYSDCWVDDARFVVLNAIDAANRGADILTRTEVTALERRDGVWQVTLQPADGGPPRDVTARLVVNAAGPWVDGLLGRISGAGAPHNVRLVQGSHIIVPRIAADPRCYIFQNADGRIIFAIPYENDYTLIGTTDRDYDGDPGKSAITPEEIGYLCSAASEYFREPIAPESIVWTYAGVRPLYDDGATSAQKATRDYVLRRDGDAETGALLNVFGGKITTYRKLGEAVLDEIGAVLGERGGPWTASAPLPGGNVPLAEVEAARNGLAADYPFLDAAMAARLWRTYGTQARTLLGGARSLDDLGRHFGADLYAAEVHYLIDREWARCAEDILWRRTKRGLRMTAAEAEVLDAYVETVLRDKAPASAAGEEHVE